jgi:hypothetical protein
MTTTYSPFGFALLAGLGLLAVVFAAVASGRGRVVIIGFLVLALCVLGAALVARQKVVLEQHLVAQQQLDAAQARVATVRDHAEQSGGEARPAMRLQVGPSAHWPAVHLEMSDPGSTMRIGPEVEIGNHDVLEPSPPDGTMRAGPESQGREPWKSAADLGFAASLHPSFTSAAESLVRELLVRKQEVAPDSAIQRFQVTCAATITPCLRDPARSAIESRLRKLHPEWTNLDSNPVPVEGTLLVQVEEATQPGVAAVAMRLTWETGEVSGTAAYVHKPWVLDAGYLGPRSEWVVGFSGSAGSPWEAHVQALQDAADRLAPRLLPGLAAGTDERWLRSRIAQVLSERGREPHDRFAQVFVRSYGGQICREAVLVQASAVQAALSRPAIVHVASQTPAWFEGLFSGTVLILLVCMIGGLLNVMTRGYHRGRLLTAGGVLLLGGLVAVILLRYTVLRFAGAF